MARSSIVIVIVIAIACVIAPAAAGPAPRVVTVVDEAGHPIAGAKVQWAQEDGRWSCDSKRPPWMNLYVQPPGSTGTAVTDRAGAVALPAVVTTVRAIAPDGRAGFRRIDRDATVVVHRVATITIEPSCDGPCSDRLVVNGSVSSDGAICLIESGNYPSTDTSVEVPRVARGVLELALREGRDADERASSVHQAIDRDTVLAPMLPRIAGSLTIKGRLTLDGTVAPARDNFSVYAICSPDLTRSATIDASTGSFILEYLPARTCELRVSGGAGDHRYERRLDVKAGSELAIELHPK